MARNNLYRYYQPEKILSAADPQLNDSNPSVGDVELAFANVATKGEYLGAWDGGLIPWPRYTANIDNSFGRGNHFQGIQRLQTQNYLVISGGDPHEACSHLFIVRMGSRIGAGGWRSNLIATGRPFDADEVVGVIGIDPLMWHAGGISTCGDILAVPIYGVDENEKMQCRIVFYDFSKPESPGQFDFFIDRPGMKAGAVAITKLQNGHFLAAVWSDSDSLPTRLDFYLSRSNNFFEGFNPQATTWYASQVRASNGNGSSFDHFQNINFINRRDGRLFLVGMHNTSTLAPTLWGNDFADLYEIDFPGGHPFKSNPELEVPTVTKLAKKQFYSNVLQSNMDAAAGVYVDADGVLRVYSAYHWRSDGVIRFNEYRPVPDFVRTQIANVNDAWIDLYEHHDFSGRCLSFVGTDHVDFANYSRISVHGATFDDRVSSARFQLPAGRTYRLFEDRDYRGQHIDLIGNGGVKEINDFKTLDFGDKVSSSRYLV